MSSKEARKIEKLWDELILERQRVEENGSAQLNYYLAIKQLSKDLTLLVKEVEADCLDYIEARWGDQEFDYANRKVKIEHRKGMIDYSSVEEIMDTQAVLDQQKNHYKHLLLSLERSRATLVDGHVVSPDGEMIPLDKFPRRKPSIRYIRSSSKDL